MDVTFHILALVLAKRHTHSLPTPFTGITLKCLLDTHNHGPNTAPASPNDLITCQAKGRLAEHIENAYRVGDQLQLCLAPPTQQGKSWRILSANLH